MEQHNLSLTVLQEQEAKRYHAGPPLGTSTRTTTTRHRPRKHLRKQTISAQTHRLPHTYPPPLTLLLQELTVKSTELKQV